MSITSKAVGDLAQVLAEILITANTALDSRDEETKDALISIRDKAQIAILTVGTKPEYDPLASARDEYQFERRIDEWAALYDKEHE